MPDSPMGFIAAMRARNHTNHNPPGTPIDVPIAGATTDTPAWVHRELDAHLAEFSAMTPDSGRNTELNNLACEFGRLPIGREQLRERLLQGCHTNGLAAEDGTAQCEATIASGLAKADLDGPRTITVAAPIITEVSPEDIGGEAPTLENIEQDFWGARESLRLIYEAALSRMTAPWAVLACCVARTLCLVPPALTLPAIIGGPGSLNWFAAVAAKSGGGKGAAMHVAAQLVGGDGISIRGIGSGEGMIEAYQRGGGSQKDPPPPVVSVLFSIDEIDSLGAMGGRSGQTTMAIVRQGFSGETLGFSYRGRQSETVPSHTYRMAMIASVQPERAGVLFDDSGGGTPQRFMWFPGRDRRISASPPQWPTDQGRARVIAMLSPSAMADSLGVIAVPETVADDIRGARAASMSGDDSALDSHALFCREKFAYALATLDGRVGEINPEDWRLSGIAAAVSDWCRVRAHRGYMAGRQDQSRQRGALRGIENYERNIIEEQEHAHQIQRITVWLLKTLTSAGPLTPGELNRKAAGRDRTRLPQALASAAEQDFIKLSHGRWAIA